MGQVLRTRNLATETAVVARCTTELVPLIRRTRRDRQLLNQQWLRYDNILKARHDSDAYHGRYRAYLAVGKRVLENWATKLKNDLFPDSGKWFTVNPESRDSEEGVAVIDSLFRRFLWDHMRVRRKSGPILRQLATLGTSPLDIGWRYSERDVPTLQRIYAESGGSIRRATETIKKVVEYIGPTCRPIDLFRWYVYPTTVNDLVDLTLIFEDMLLDRSTIDRLGRTWIHPGDQSLGHQFEHVDRVQALFTSGGSRADQEKWNAERTKQAERGLHSPVDTHEDPNQLLACTKAYWRVDLQDIDEDGETTPEPRRWYQVVLAGAEDIPLQIRPCVFWDGDPSYLAPKFIEVMDEFYGYGVPASFDSLAYMVNDVLNQGADALTFSLNPIAAIDPGAVQDMTTLRMKPGAKWLIRQPRQNVQFIEPPKDSSAAAMAAVNNLLALINDSANVAPIGGTVGPRARGRALQTASGMAMVASENLVQVHDIIQSCEDLWLDPMLRKMYSRTEQCLDMPVLLNIEGARGAALIQRQVTREDLIGEFTFRWQASVSNYNQQVRGQQMIGFFQQISRLPPGLLEKENARISLKYLLRAIWSEGLQLPESDRLIEDIQPVHALDAALENQLFETGRGDTVQVSPADDDMAHLKTHDALFAPGALPPAYVPGAVAHQRAHLTAIQTKQQMAQMAQMQQMTQAGSGLGGMAPPSNGQAGPIQPPMNPGRPQRTSTPGDLLRTMDRPPGMTGAGGEGPGPQ
jgi:hypothetical protein